MDTIDFAGAHGAPTATINNQARAAGVPACALAAIGSRESGFRNVFQDGMPRGPGCGVGDCQITFGVDWTDPERPTYAGRELLDRSQNYYVAGAFFLRPAIDGALRLRTRYAMTMNALSGEILYFAFAAYNAGMGTVAEAIAAGTDPDARTTANYASDTLRRYHEYLDAAHALVRA